MKLSPLSDNSVTPFEEAVLFAARSRSNGGVYGLKGSAPLFLTAAAVRQGTGPVVIVSPDGERASAAASDIRFYMGEEEFSENSLEDQVLFYPSSDLQPYSVVAFETDIWIARMAVLFRLCHGRAPRVVSVGLDALIRKVLPRSDLLRTSFSLAVGDEVNREDLLKRFIEAGYSRSPLVEDAGEFSVRGFIIDLYPPLYHYPVRIEQDGDRVESIRLFDPSNQRSRGDIPEVLWGRFTCRSPTQGLAMRA